YSACSTWLVHKNDAHLVHVYRGRLEYPDLRRKVIGLAAEHRATTVLIEDAGPGMNLLQDLRATMPGGMTRPIGVKPAGSKVDRMAQSAKIEATTVSSAGAGSACLTGFSRHSPVDRSQNG